MTMTIDRTDEEFDRLIAIYTARGYLVAARSQDYVTLVFPRRTNHVLHLLLTLVTLGLWAPVWLFLGLTTKDVRVTLHRGAPVNLWLTRNEARMFGLEKGAHV